MADHTVPAIVPLLFEGDGLLRVVIRNGEPWFVADDVCRILRIRQATRAVENLLNDHEKAEVSIDAGTWMKRLLIVSRTGLYVLNVRARGAGTSGTVQHRFHQWVKAEVLPVFRETDDHEDRLDRQERRLRVMEKNVARRLIRELKLASGTPWAKAIPAICAQMNIILDRDALEALGLLAPDDTETVH